MYTNNVSKAVNMSPEKANIELNKKILLDNLTKKYYESLQSYNKQV